MPEHLLLGAELLLGDAALVGDLLDEHLLDLDQLLLGPRVVRLVRHLGTGVFGLCLAHSVCNKQQENQSVLCNNQLERLVTDWVQQKVSVESSLHYSLLQTPASVAPVAQGGNIERDWFDLDWGREMSSLGRWDGLRASRLLSRMRVGGWLMSLRSVQSEFT